MPTPVVLLAFSNDMDNPLSSLKRESRNIARTVAALEDRRMLRLFREDKSTTDDLLESLHRLSDPANDYQLVVFHYGGHADGDTLRFEDSPGHGDGLARLLGSFRSSLALVFLNGCSTLPQVQQLIDAGVKAVIATSAPIRDEHACHFAEFFYRKLASRASLGQAFDFAAQSLQFKYGRTAERIAVDRTRSIGGGAAATAMPWGLYYDRDNPAVLDWKFRAAEPPVIARPDIGAFRANDYLLDVAWAISEHFPEVRAAIENNTCPEGEQYEFILKNFPWLISAQIRVLLAGTPAMAAPTAERLEQLLCTYTAAAQLVYFILLSNLWDQKLRGNLDRPGLDWEDIAGLTPDNFRSFDFISCAGRILEEIKSHPRATVFMAELTVLADSFQKKDAFYEACLYLESRREQYLAAVPDGTATDLTGTCLDTEYALSVVLAQLSFLAKYQMITVRDIKLSKVRYGEPSYKHFIAKLHVHLESSIIVSDQPATFASFLDDRSVILVKSLDRVDNFLNLTPFIIDRNAYGDKKDHVSNLCNLIYAAPVEGMAGEQYFYLVSGKSLLNYDVVNPNEAHLIHTGLKKQLDPTNRRPVFRPMDDQYPFATLREQLEHFKSDWQK